MNPALAPDGRHLRVLQVITQLGLGGAERVALSLVAGLHDRVDFGVFTVHAETQDAVGAAMENELAALGVPWFRGTLLPVKFGGMLSGGAALGRAIRTFQPDVVHYHTEIPEACGAVLAAWDSSGQPAVVRTIHNSIYWRFWPAIGRWCDRQLAEAHVACVSAAAWEEFARYRRNSGVPPRPALVIANGVRVPPPDVCVRPLAAGRRRLLFAGRLEDQKGVDVLARALPEVKLPAGVAAELVVVGTGTHEPLLRSLARRPPAGWQVTVQPPVAALPALFPQFDLVVLPSRFEGLPLVAIEAALSGVPVVASRAPGLDEALPADYPWRSAPGDATQLALALSGALNDTAHWPVVTAGARAWAQERFDPARMMTAYLALYRQAANDRAGHSPIA